MGLLRECYKETMIMKKKADEVGKIDDDEGEVAVYEDDELVQMVEV
jgi:hypothetical protein